MMDLLALASKFAVAAVQIDRETDRGVEKAAKIIEKGAKDVIGTYDAGWAPLGPAAIARHGDTPLLDTGALRESIEHTADGKEAFIGTNDPVGKYQEFGTSRGIPPRPFMGASVTMNEEVVRECFVEVIRDAI